MKKTEIYSSLAISAGLGLIFGYASHHWYGGLIVGICYFVCSILIYRKRNDR